MANHMLYHIDDSDRKLLLGYVNAMLTDDGKVYAVRFNLGAKEWIDFRVESTEDLMAVYDWLDEEVK